MNHVKKYNQFNENATKKELDLYNEEDWGERPKPKPKKREIECWVCKGWGSNDDGEMCKMCDGSGKIRVKSDYKGPTWNIGGASDISYGS